VPSLLFFPAQLTVDQVSSYLEHEDWVDNVKAQAKEKPLRIDAVSYLS